MWRRGRDGVRPCDRDDAWLRKTECRRFCVDVGRRRRLARVVYGGLWRRNRCHAGQWLEAEWIQLQLSGGSIPGKEIEAITQEGSTLVVRLKKPNSDMETMDLCLTEYRVAGGDVSSVESVVVEDKGERLEAQLGVDGEARAVQ